MNNLNTYDYALLAKVAYADFWINDTLTATDRDGERMKPENAPKLIRLSIIGV